MPAALGLRTGCLLVSLLPENAIALAKPKHTLLPFLVVLFLISYGLMALLVVEQGRTIDSQRNLIRSLFDDSSQLSQLKGKNFQKQHAEAQAQAEANAKSQAHHPSTQAQPGDNATSKHGSSKLKKQVPQNPPEDTSDTADQRRNLFSI
jgi:hypothetical protein